MSILNRLNRLIRSNINEAIDRSDRSSIRSAFKEMEESLREARRQQAEMRRNERQLIDAIHAARDEADEWEERAMLALQNDDEELAREAIKEKNRTLAKADQLREELDEHRSHMADIEKSLEALEMKLQGQKSRLKEGPGSRRRTERTGRTGGGDRSSRKKRARQWERRLQERRSTDGGDGDTGPKTATPHDDVFDSDQHFEEFDRMAGKIDNMEAEIEAMRELSGDDWPDSRRAELERIFRQMEGRGDFRRAKRRAERGPKDSEQADQNSREEGARDRRSRRSRGSRSKSDDRRQEGGSRDDLAGKKRRMDRLSELKDKFDDEE